MTSLKLNIRSLHLTSDAALGIALLSIIGALLVPLPSWVVDLGLALNLAVSVLLLLTAMRAKDALRLATFPTVLLLSTLVRLSLNVSSTRLALSEGSAGRVIEAVGEFVIRGNFAVGSVVFLILSVVQFLVVAKGSERVAEVAARFTLDALPGKQMAIDADLRAGTIDQAQATLRRSRLERESQLFGALDGAMKFVKGDVIAGLIVVAVNLFAGTALGVFQQSLSWSEAAATYALIAIGDGLVSQIPSLCVAIAAALVVTRVASENEQASLGSDIAQELFGRYETLGVVGGMCAVLAVVPGLPGGVFTLCALGFLGAAFARKRFIEGGSESPATPKAQGGGPVTGAPNSRDVFPLAIELARDLGPLATLASGDLAKVLDERCLATCEALGIERPAVSLRFGDHLGPGQFRVLFFDTPESAGVTGADECFALVPASELAVFKIEGRTCKHPSTLKEVTRVSSFSKGQLNELRVPALNACEWIAEHVEHVLRSQAAELLGIDEVQAILSRVEMRAPALVREVSQKVPLALLTAVLKRILEERLSIRNVRVLLEALAAPSATGDASALAERCREAMHRELSHRVAPQGSLYALLVDPPVEAALLDSGAALEPELAQGILECVRTLVPTGVGTVLASPDVRRWLRKLLEVPFPEVDVLSFRELSPHIAVRPIGKITCKSL